MTRHFYILCLSFICCNYACKRPRADTPMPAISAEMALIQQLGSLQQELALNKDEQKLVEDELKTLKAGSSSATRVTELDAELKRLKLVEQNLSASINKLSAPKK